MRVRVRCGVLVERVPILKCGSKDVCLCLCLSLSMQLRSQRAEGGMGSESKGAIHSQQQYDADALQQRADGGRAAGDRPAHLRAAQCGRVLGRRCCLAVVSG
jgi:hypothetical protein